MPKLNKRQIIILVLMACAVLYAVYELFFAGSAKNSTATIQKSAVSMDSSAAVPSINEPLAAVNAYIITRAEADWPRNPFIERNAYKDWTAREGAAAGTTVAAVKIIYSGYLDAGAKKMAIINGLEYSPGEKLEMEGYVLKEIRPSKVIISNRNTGSELEVFIQE
jgi:hypothetical protein